MSQESKGPRQEIAYYLPVDGGELGSANPSNRAHFLANPPIRRYLLQQSESAILLER